MAYAAAKGHLIKDSLAAMYVHQYFDLKMYAELGFKESINDLDCYEAEAMRRVSMAFNKAQADEIKKNNAEAKRKRK